MIAVIFEVEPAPGQRQAYLDIAAALRPRLDQIDGFLSIARCESLPRPGRDYSLTGTRRRPTRPAAQPTTNPPPPAPAAAGRGIVP